MCSLARCRLLVALTLSLLVVADTCAQQAVAPQQAVQQQAIQPQGAQPQQPPVVQVPNGFQLNPLQQAALDQVLDRWQVESGKISTFWCPFERWEYDVAFGPENNMPLNKNSGELSYHKPDKGSFQITEIKTFQRQAAPAGQQPPAEIKGDWVKQPNAIGEHWVCDGKSVYEYRQSQKLLVERSIPPQLQGQAIVDGPLPFLFGAESAKLKQRYWLKLDERNDNPNQIWLVALPKFREQAADFSEVDVILDPKNRMLPQYMQVWMPNRSRHMYMFKLGEAKVNNVFNRLQGLFDRPITPIGYKHVVENMPLQQAAQPAPAPR